MGFILKTNNRKVESGTTLRAKIVSPDKTAYDYQEFPVIVQPQSLSDKEKLLRDYQTIASILDSNNPDWQITDKIRGLTEAVRAVTYSQVLYGDQVSNSATSLVDSGTDSSGQQIINVTSGEVVKRPVYKSDGSNNFSAVLNLTLKIGSGSNEEKMLFTRAFVVPSWQKGEILGKLSDKWVDNVIWPLIKKGTDNVNKTNIFASVRKPDATTVLNELELSSMIDMTDNANLPTLEWTYPTYFTDTLLAADGSIGNLTATKVYQADRTQYNVIAVKSNQLEDECNALGINNNKSKGETVAYRLNSKTSSDNKITGKWVWGTSVVEGSVNGVAFLSQLVSMSDVKDNVVKSFSLGWFIPADALNAYGIADQVIPSSNSASNKFNLHIPAGMHLVFKLPSRFTTMITNDTNPVVDTNKIGYIYDPTNGKNEGFDDKMFGAVTITTGFTMHSTYSPIDVTDATAAVPGATAGDNTTFNAENQTKYLYLNASELTSISGSITLPFAENSLADDTPSITIYFNASNS